MTLFIFDAARFHVHIQGVILLISQSRQNSQATPFVVAIDNRS